MNPNTIRIVLAVFLVVHGLIHASLTNVPVPKPGELHTPFFPAWWRASTDATWPVAKLGLSNGLVRGLGSALWLLATLGCALAGLGLLGVPGLSQVWTACLGVGGVASLLVMALYWHPWYVVGAGLSVALLAGLGLHLPKFLFA
jgi:hypothetical protein